MAIFQVDHLRQEEIHHGSKIQPPRFEDGLCSIVARPLLVFSPFQIPLRFSPSRLALLVARPHEGDGRGRTDGEASLAPLSDGVQSLGGGDRTADQLTGLTERNSERKRGDKPVNQIFAHLI